jgi:GNAT superfamily N-acetyltransferase
MFTNFLQGSRTNTWIEAGPIRIYLRKTDRTFNDKLLPTIDVANILILPRYQRRGLFTACLQHIEDSPSVSLVYIENVMGTSPENGSRLVAYLKRRGYDFYREYSEYERREYFAPCLIKYVGGNHEANKGNAEAGKAGWSAPNSEKYQ